MAIVSITQRRKTEHLKFLLRLYGIGVITNSIPTLVEICKQEIPNFIEPSEVLFVKKNHRLEDVDEQSDEV